MSDDRDPRFHSNVDKPSADGDSKKAERRVGWRIARFRIGLAAIREHVPFLAIFVSVIAVTISGLNYHEVNTDAVRRTKIDYAIRSVLYRNIIVWEEVLVIVGAQTKSYPIDLYVFHYAKENTRMLLTAMDSAVEAGGLDLLLGTDRYNLDMYVAFVQGLQAQADLRDDGKVPLADWTRQHVLMGLARQLDNLIDYPNSGLSPSIIKRIRTEIEPVRVKSHSYIKADNN